MRIIFEKTAGKGKGGEQGARGRGTGYWLLVTGYWILVTGYWILDTGYWLLVTGDRKSVV